MCGLLAPRAASQKPPGTTKGFGRAISDARDVYEQVIYRLDIINNIN